MRQACRQAGAMALAVAILCVCGWLSISRCPADEIMAVNAAAGERALARSNRVAIQGNGKLAAEFLQGAPRNHFVGEDIAYRRGCRETLLQDSRDRRPGEHGRDAPALSR